MNQSIRYGGPRTVFLVFFVLAVGCSVLAYATPQQARASVREPAAEFLSAVNPHGTMPPAETPETGLYSGKLILELNLDLLAPDDIKAPDISAHGEAIAAHIGAGLGTSKLLDALPGWVAIDLHTTDPEVIQDAARLAAALPTVRSAVPDRTVPVERLGQLFPNDPDFGNLWGLHNVGQTLSNGVVPTAGVDINAPEAWDIVTDASNVIVAVIDDGVDYTHDDLDGNIWINSGEIAGNGVDDDSNGYIDDVHGWDFGDDDNDPTGNTDMTPGDGIINPSYHGTAVAGIIGAEGNNALGVSGVAWSVQLMPIKLFASSTGGFSNLQVIDAINYAVANGATISNHSWGVRIFALLNDGLTLEEAEAWVGSICDAIDTAAGSDHLVVAAAGNNIYDNDTDTERALYPATCPQDNVIAVTGIDETDMRYGNYGPTTVDLAAPAYYIWTTALNDSYAYVRGTSAATAFVSGGAALVRAQDSSLTYAEVKSNLLDVRPVVDLTDDVLSDGALYLSNIATLPVTLSYAYAEQQDGFVDITWVTATEVANAGFNLLSGADPSAVPLNSALIPSQAIDSTAPLTYHYRVNRATPESIQQYFIQEVGLDGAVHNHGPFQLNLVYGSLPDHDPIEWPNANDDELPYRLYVPGVVAALPR